MTSTLLDTSLAPSRGGLASGHTPKVLHVLWSGELGGAERAVHQLIGAQQAQSSSEPAVLFAQSRGPYIKLARSLGCEVRELELADNRSVWRLPEIVRRLRGFDVHHFHSAEPLLMAASSLLPSTARVYTHRGGTYHYGPAKRLRFELCGVLLRRSFHAYSGNTAHAARSGAALYRMKSEQFRVTYNGVDWTSIQPARPPEEIRAEVGLGAADLVLGTAAVLKPWKRIDRLVRAVGALRLPGLRLVVVGDGEERGRLQALAAALGIGSSVHFVGRQERPWDYLQVMDIFSLPSMALESFGNAAVEAMALGLPTIVFADGGGLLEHVEHGRTGMVVRTQSELEHVISRLMKDGALRAQLGTRACETVCGRYSMCRAANAYDALYADAIAESVSRAAA